MQSCFTTAGRTFTRQGWYTSTPPAHTHIVGLPVHTLTHGCCASLMLQVAGYDTVGALAAEDAACISSLEICNSTGRVAFTQASGVLNLYPVQELVEDARQVRRRWDSCCRQHSSTAGHLCHTRSARHEHSKPATCALRSKHHEHTEPGWLHSLHTGSPLHFNCACINPQPAHNLFLPSSTQFSATYCRHVLLS